MTLLDKVNSLLADKPNACEFVNAYVQYIEVVDDLVDEEKDTANVRKCVEMSAKVFNCNYWKQYGANLILLDRVIARTYFDSAVWEKSSEEWKRRDAKCLSHSGYLMLFAVIIIEFGEDKLNEFSLEIREYAHMKHINDKI